MADFRARKSKEDPSNLEEFSRSVIVPTYGVKIREVPEQREIEKEKPSIPLIEYDSIDNTISSQNLSSNV